MKFKITLQQLFSIIIFLPLTNGNSTDNTGVHPSISLIYTTDNTDTSRIEARTHFFLFKNFGPSPY